MRRFVLVLCLALVGLAGCSSGAEAIEVTVNGNLGAPVTISLEGDKVPASVTKDVVIAGKGREIEEDSAVLLRATSFDSRTGSIIESYDTGGIRLATANSDGLGELAGQIVGATEGSRLVITRPGLASGQDAAEIVVVDLLPTIAQGEETPLPDPAPQGTPKICPNCGKTFHDSTTKRKVYCSFDCQRTFCDRQAAQRYRDRKAAERAAVSNGG